jgi:hypothetical protein
VSNCITDVLVNVSLFGIVLKEAEPDNPNAQPVSGVLNTTGTATYFTFFVESNLNCEKITDGTNVKIKKQKINLSLLKKFKKDNLP